MAVGIVVLNYNDWENSSRLVEELETFPLFSCIVIVDNASTDDSLSRLGALENERVKLLGAKENKGYGAGNNLGLRYLFEKGMHHAFLANPDTSFTENYFSTVLSIFQREKEAGLVSGRMQDGIGLQQTAWKLHSFVPALLASGPMSRRLFSSLLFYKKSYLEKKPYVQVDCLHGSCLCFSKESFEKSGGFDEDFFLYEEENVIGQRMKDAGYKVFLCTAVSYLHQDSGSTGKNIKSLVKRQTIRQASERLYYSKYLSIGSFRKAMVRFFQTAVLLETLLFELCSQRKKI